jgi:acetoin utilization deacetylase AcuC-like enzyme
MPLSDKDILLVHDKEYLDWVKKPLNLQQILNTNYLTEFDEDVFNIFRYIAGGTYEGAILSLDNKKPSFNLSGGFHHARANMGEGFCPINDVAIAIKKLKKEQKIKRALIIDLDYHQGNGTRNIFRSDEDVFTFSIHATQWCDLEAKSSLDLIVETDISNENYIEVLKENLRLIRHSFSTDIIFYLSGSDTFIDDALCDMSLDMTTLLKRDLIVCNFSKSLNVPMVVLPAGGYGDKSWQIYYNFIKYCLLYR